MQNILHRISKISTRTLLYLFLTLAVITVLALRHNNQTMVNLRSELYAADKNNGNVEQSLYKLRKYVLAHMNTNLSSGNNNIKPPIQLQYTYQRLVESQLAKVQQTNQKIYTDAQNYCQSINNAYYGTTRVPCVQNYVVRHGVKETSVSVPAGLYQFDFVSPTWSPDFAGWSLVITLILLMALIIRITLDKLAHKK